MNTKNQNYRIALYIRVSTEEQAENPEGSIRNQEHRLREAVAYKNRNGTFGEIHGVFTDAGISAKDMRRPKLQELLRAIRNKEINLVMVTELSRLSRNTRDFIQMWDMMREHGCRFQTLREDFDTTNAAGELLIMQLMNLAQFERRQTSERVEANVAARAARGLYNGGHVPVGYKIIPEKPGYLAVDDEMAAIVREAFGAFLREGSLSNTARWLNEQGYRLQRKTEGGGRHPRVGHFTVDNLQTMLRNKVYVGVKKYSVKGESKEAKAVWPAIIDEGTFTRAGEVLGKNRYRLKPWKQGRMPYVLSGSVHCLKCGSSMPGKSATTGSGVKLGYYEHSWAAKRGSTLSQDLFRCEPHRVQAKRLEPLVMEKLKQLLSEEGFMDRILARVRMHHAENPSRKEQEGLKAKIHGLNSQLDALTERIAELPKTVSADPIYRRMEKLETLRKGHEAALRALKQEGTDTTRIVGLDTFENFVSRYRNFVLRDASVPEQKQMVKKFIRKVEVGVDSVKVHYIVDQDWFARELASKEAGSRPLRGLSGNSIDLRSNTLTFGGHKLRSHTRSVRQKNFHGYDSLYRTAFQRSKRPPNPIPR